MAENEEDMKKAMGANDAEFMERKLKVAIAKPQEEKKEKPKTQFRRRNFGNRRFYNNRRPQMRRNTQKKQEKDETPKEISENVIFVKNLPFSVNDEKFKEIFDKFGVKEAKVISRRRYTKVFSKGFGFVTFENKENQQKAIAEMNGFEIEGRKIAVSAAFKRQEKPQTTEKK